MMMHYYFDDRCAVGFLIMRNHVLKHASSEHNVACEPLECAICLIVYHLWLIGNI